MAANLEKLEAMEHAVHKYLDLLNQADQALEEAINVAEDYESSKGDGPPDVADIRGALTTIQKVIGEFQASENELTAKIKYVKEKAQEHADQQAAAGADPGY